jgi:hypothetical protein
MSGWMPIETAPLENVGALRQHIIISDGRYVMVAWYNLAAGDWYNTACHRIAGQPTHWMPLPNPPLHSPNPAIGGEG